MPSVQDKTAGSNVSKVVGKTSGLRAGAVKTLGRVRDGLPLLALFLCLSMFAMAAVVLIGANTEPVTGQQSNVTSVSAQGFQGLKRLLIARGHPVSVNRDADSLAHATADLEIITLDGDTSNFLFGADPDQKTAVKPKTVAGASDSAGLTGVADPDKVRHILRTPLGRTVLLVMPKWMAGPVPKHANWDIDPQLADPDIVFRDLGLVSPVSSAPAALSLGKPKLAPLPPGKARLITTDGRLLTYTPVHGTLWRHARLKTQAEQKAEQQKMAQLGPAFMKPVDAWVPFKQRWTLPAQNGFPALDLGTVSALQALEADTLQPVLRTSDGHVLVSRVIVPGGPPPKVPVYVLSDPDLLNNQILSDPKRVVAALSLVEAIAPSHDGHPASISFNLVYNGLGFDHDLLHSLARPPYIGAPLCLLLIGLALMWAAFMRFGPPLPVAEGAALGRGVQILADNAARLMGLTLKVTKLAPAYAQHIRDMVLRSCGYMQVSSQASPDELADRIGRAHGTTEAFLDLKARAEASLTLHQLIDITRRLYAWKTEIDRAHI
jgi:hypothetical protein